MLIGIQLKFTAPILRSLSTKKESENNAASNTAPQAPVAKQSEESSETCW